MTKMSVGEYRDLIDAVFAKVASCKSAATPEEHQAESDSLSRLVDELNNVVSPRSSIRDQTRAATARLAAQGILKDRLWQEYDNQHVEEMERMVRE